MGHGSLLVLRGKGETTDFLLDAHQRRKRFPPGMEHIAALAIMGLFRPQGDRLVLLGDGRKIQMMPIAALKQMAGEIVLVKPLHEDDHHNRAPCR